jgi:hypothetical protein
MCMSVWAIHTPQPYIRSAKSNTHISMVINVHERLSHTYATAIHKVGQIKHTISMWINVHERLSHTYTTAIHKVGQIKHTYIYGNKCAWASEPYIRHSHTQGRPNQTHYIYVNKCAWASEPYIRCRCSSDNPYTLWIWGLYLYVL